MSSPRSFASAMLAAAAFAVGTLEAPPVRADSPLGVTARALAASLLHDLASPPADVVVVASPLASDVASARGDELALRVAALVAAGLGPGTRVGGKTASLPGARAVARAAHGPGLASALVYVDVRIEAGELRLTADLYARPPNVWDRLRVEAPGSSTSAAPPPAAHAYVHAPVGAEVRAYLPPLHLERAQVSRASVDLGPVLALACGDVDGAAGVSLVLVTSREVAWGHLEGGRFVAARRAAATSLAPRLAVPMREAFATATLAPLAPRGAPDRLLVGWGDRAAVALSAALAPTGRLAGAPVAAGAGVACLAVDAPHAGLAGGWLACDGQSALPAGLRPRTAATSVDGWASLDLVDASGHVTSIAASHEPDGLLRVAGAGGDGGGVADPPVATDRGAQLVLADLDQDGVAELVSTLARGDDAIVVETVRGGRLEPRLRIPAPAGVDALAVCPPDVGAAPSVVAVVGKELWVVR